MQLTLDYFQFLTDGVVILLLLVSWFWFQSGFARQREDIRQDMNTMRDEIIATIESKQFVTVDECNAVHAGVADLRTRVDNLEERISGLERG